jgi:tricarballylate dehydrogenase
LISKETDVLVIGGGNAGLCAAIAAREAGANVMLVEHADRNMRGGNSRHTRNLRAMHDGPLATLRDSYPEEEYWQDIVRVTGGKTDEALARYTIRNSSPLVKWLEGHGVHFQPALSGTLNLSRTNAFFLGGGKALVNALYLSAERLGIEIHYGAEAQSLVIENGRFRSARLQCGDSTLEVKAQALVVASGGFQANTDWLKEVWGDKADNFLVRGTPYAKGRMLKELLRNGMKSVGSADQCHAVAIDARAPKFDGGIVSRLDSVPFGIVVNRRAERFYDEGEDFWPKRYAIWGRLVADQPDQIAYSIIDSSSIDRFMPSVFPAIQADSIEQLAPLLELDGAKLSATIQRFNESIVTGHFDQTVLDDCHTIDLEPPKSHWARPVDSPPFYAYPLRPGITFTYLGVAVDGQARVIQAAGVPCENVFAAGEIMAGNILGRGYCAGMGMSIGGVFGRTAGEGAALQL